jgi:hypothetical protein
VIANDTMVRHTGLEELCIVANTPAAFKQALQENFKQSFKEEEVGKRKQILQSLFDNRTNAAELAHLVRW